MENRTDEAGDDRLTRLSNRLTALAADVRSLDAGIRRSAERVAEDAITTGHKLIEAKSLLRHGLWLLWLRDHAAISERSARRYMRIARSGLSAATVADLGMAGAEAAVSRPEQKDREADLELDRLAEQVRDDTGHFLRGFRRVGQMLIDVRSEVGEAGFKEFLAETGMSIEQAEEHIAFALSGLDDDTRSLNSIDIARYFGLPAGSEP